MKESKLKEMLFPHETVRPIQDELLEAVERVLSKKKHLIVHAPTGLGKTAATLGPAIAFALQKDLTVFFLTSRHTQHRIALDTARAVQDKYSVQVPVANLIGKKWMCLHDGVENMYSNEFFDYCRKVREDGNCSYYENLKSNGSLSRDAKQALTLAKEKPDSGALKMIGRQCRVCPYEIGILAAKDARVIVTDYFYVFSPHVKDVFFQKIGKDPSKCIFIVDEAHNLPSRIKDLASANTSARVAEFAMKEATKYDYDFPELESLRDSLVTLSEGVSVGDEKLVSKDELAEVMNTDFDVELLESAGDTIREEQKRSWVGSVGNFLESWIGADEGFARILQVTDDTTVLSYRCLDPGIVTGPVIRESYSTILMSGTLAPTVMYAELLDVPLNCEEYTFKSPFPEEHRLTLVVPQTTTKYTARSEEMYASQARILARIVDSVPGNTLVFFPSYSLLRSIEQTFSTITKRAVFTERRGMNKDEREELLKKFRGYKDTGAVLLAVSSGSFSEGIDLPGDLLKAVVVVGLPLARPDLEAKSLIEYYDEKFKRGWDYGYVFPAFNKVLQGAGRCIRSETDKGAIVFLDERYGWRTYQRCFPPHWNLRMTVNPDDDIKKFFD